MRSFWGDGTVFGIGGPFNGLLGNPLVRSRSRRASPEMSHTDSAHGDDFSLSKARSIVGHLFKLRPEIYWCDFLLTYGLGIFCFQQVRGGNLFVPHQGFAGTWSQTFFYFASCLLYYRASMFIHEVVHQRNGKLPVFRFVWNLLCGIPFLTPSFIYYTHIDHHRRARYGTEQDGEYMPMTHRSPWFMFFLSILVSVHSDRHGGTIPDSVANCLDKSSRA